MIKVSEASCVLIFTLVWNFSARATEAIPVPGKGGIRGSFTTSQDMPIGSPATEAPLMIFAKDAFDSWSKKLLEGIASNTNSPAVVERTWPLYSWEGKFEQQLDGGRYYLCTFGYLAECLEIEFEPGQWVVLKGSYGFTRDRGIKCISGFRLCQKAPLKWPDLALAGIRWTKSKNIRDRSTMHIEEIRILPFLGILFKKFAGGKGESKFFTPSFADLNTLQKVIESVAFQPAKANKVGAKTNQEQEMLEVPQLAYGRQECSNNQCSSEFKKIRGALKRISPR